MISILRVVSHRKVRCVLGLMSFVGAATAADLPPEQLLWKEASVENPIRYAAGETVRSHDAASTAPSGLNRVFGRVSQPTYSIFRPEKGKANGVGLVICPGGGYREVWLDREGHDLAVWLRDRGVTSLVLKYRTNSAGEDGQQQYPWEVYLPAVFADARQAIRLLRAQAAELGVDPEKIGICGFSAGGNLALNTVLRAEPEGGAGAVRSDPDFAGLFYPWFREEFEEAVAAKEKIPPLFIMNAIDDQMTPVDRCVEFYQSVLKAGVPAELHLYSRGGHGFDMGEGRGESTAIWKESFVAWLKDAGFDE